MKIQFRLTILSFLSMLAIGMNTRSVSAQLQAQPARRAQPIQPAHSHDGHDHGGHSHAKEFIAFQLLQWKTIHFNDVAKVKQHADMVRKLGREVKQGQHAGHSDVKFRAPTWRDVHVAEHAAAVELGAILKKNGFEIAPHNH